MGSKGVKRAPYREGSLLEWTGYAIDTVSDGPGWAAPDEWRDNVPVEMVLKLIDTEILRSVARFIWKDSEGHSFPMFMTDIAALIIEHGHRIKVEGVVRGTWIVKKRGANYGIALHDSKY